MTNAYLMNGPMDGTVVEVAAAALCLEVPILSDLNEYQVATYDRTDMKDETGVIYEYRTCRTPSGEGSATDPYTVLPPLPQRNPTWDSLGRNIARQIQQANRRGRGSSWPGRIQGWSTLRGEEWDLSPKGIDFSRCTEY